MKSTSKSMIFSMAIRNIVRNKRRSLLSACTIFIVIIFGCVMVSLIYAQIDDMQINVIDQVTGNIRLRNQLYTDNERVQPLQFSIPNTDELVTFIKSQDGVVGAEPQINVNTIVDPNGDPTVTAIVGVNFETSRFFSDRNTEIISGKIPSSADKKATVITPFMAKRFNLKVGDKFTSHWTKTAIGANAVTLTVSAIATIGNTDFSGLYFFMDWKLLSDNLRMNGNALEILVYTEENLAADETEKLISSIQKYANADTLLEVKEWSEVSFVFQLIQQNKQITLVMMLFFCIMAATIILNSTMMAVLERKKEIGALMSLGMEAKHIKNLFLLESTLLAFMASLVGIVIGFIVVSILGNTGINMLAMGVGEATGLGISSWLYPKLTFDKYLFLLLVGTLTATIACIIPARMALKVQPAEALRSAE